MIFCNFAWIVWLNRTHMVTKGWVIITHPLVTMCQLLATEVWTQEDLWPCSLCSISCPACCLLFFKEKNCFWMLLTYYKYNYNSLQSKDLLSTYVCSWGSHNIPHYTGYTVILYSSLSTHSCLHHQSSGQWKILSHKHKLRSQVQCTKSYMLLP